MWNKIIDFYKSNKYVILWTIGYFIATWAIMKYMFNFDIFSRLRWWQLAHAYIHGFAGLVFCILILAAVPMYIATTIVIARTKSPLFTIKIPEFIKNAFQQTPMPEEVVIEPQSNIATNANEITPETNDTDVPPVNNDEHIPSELRIAYARAREHISRAPMSAFDLGNMTKLQKNTQKPISQPDTINTDMPIPTDFDIEDTDNILGDIPQFTDINFDDDEDTNIEITDVNEISETNNVVAQYMKSKSVPYTVDNDVVITDKFAIVSHTDPEFWVADAENWFAAGKTRKSPIENVKRIATEHNVQPVLYLGSNNIMDIETLIPQWEQDGIHVIIDLKDLK